MSFSPYSDNGGSVVAIGGEDYVVVGADTRLHTGYSILTRNQNKLFRLTNGSVLATAGCWADALTLTRYIQARVQTYQQDHLKEISTQALAQMLSTMLYYKRFFPYYLSNVLVGLDNEGKGCVYSYDPIGHCEKRTYVAGGSVSALLQPLLDNQVGKKNMGRPTNEPPAPLSKEEAVQIVKDGFISAAERDINTGDVVMINIITADGIVEETFQLRKD